MHGITDIDIQITWEVSMCAASGMCRSGGRACAGVPLGEGLYRPLSQPQEAWHFDMRCPPEESARKTLDTEFTADGVFNAVVFWFTLHLFDGVTISSGPCASSAPGQQLLKTPALLNMELLPSGAAATVLSTSIRLCGIRFPL